MPETTEYKTAIVRECEVRSKLSRIQVSIDALRNELKTIYSEFENDIHSADALRAKCAILEKQLAEEKKRTEILQEVFSEFACNYGNTDKITLHWAKSLYYAEAVATNTENALRENIEILSLILPASVPVELERSA